ncbi:hypothetical protein BJX61DRAFT_535471 [Aspergillus egyptiacus]|nr:hypothetical protein BJX61DRAFT_535471 [Aspergillus egyptiacus]
MSSRSGSADNFGAGTTTESNQRTTTTLRPRRLISFTDDEEDTQGRQPSLSPSGLSTMRSAEMPSLRSRGATPSPRASRPISPIPMSHPSRATQSRSRSGPRSGNSLGGFNLDKKHQDLFTESPRAAVDFIDASWSSLQSLASSLLGSDTARPVLNGVPRGHERKPSRPELSTKIPSRTSNTWGPSGPTTPEHGAGTLEERQALVQAKKREALLLADTEPTWSHDSRHKRRDSSDYTGQSGLTDQDEEALVYVHQVQPTDSITSVTIRYGCQATIFRKANGFWPSDSIQARKTVLLPVDCCSVKGRPVRPQGGVDRVEKSHIRRPSEDTSGSSIVPASTPERSTFSEGPEQTSADQGAESDQLWKHEAWVQIDGFPEPVQIGRVPRRALGFFPRPRRKSVSYSDSGIVRGREQTPTISTASSPIQPMSPHNDDIHDRLYACSQLRLPNSKPNGRHRRQRSGLEFSGTGVGTLDGSVNIPGPAMDGLSKFFAQHLPNLTPKQTPPNFDSLEGNSSTVASSNTTSLDSIGGAVEGWVRKTVARAKSNFSELQQGTAGSPSHGLYQDNGRRGHGDLIELDDSVESGSSGGLLGAPSWRPEFNRSTSNLSNGSNLRVRKPSASPSTSRTRTGPDRLKDD